MSRVDVPTAKDKELWADRRGAQIAHPGFAEITNKAALDFVTNINSLCLFLGTATDSEDGSAQVIQTQSFQKWGNNIGSKILIQEFKLVA